MFTLFTSILRYSQFSVLPGIQKFPHVLALFASICIVIRYSKVSASICTFAWIRTCSHYSQVLWDIRTICFSREYLHYAEVFASVVTSASNSRSNVSIGHLVLMHVLTVAVFSYVVDIRRSTFEADTKKLADGSSGEQAHCLLDIQDCTPVPCVEPESNGDSSTRPSSGGSSGNDDADGRVGVGPVGLLTREMQEELHIVELPRVTETLRLKYRELPVEDFEKALNRTALEIYFKFIRGAAVLEVRRRPFRCEFSSVRHFCHTPALHTLQDSSRFLMFRLRFLIFFGYVFLRFSAMNSCLFRSNAETH